MGVSSSNLFSWLSGANAQPGQNHSTASGDGQGQTDTKEQDYVLVGHSNRVQDLGASFAEGPECVGRIEAANLTASRGPETFYEGQMGISQCAPQQSSQGDPPRIIVPELPRPTPPPICESEAVETTTQGVLPRLFVPDHPPTRGDDHTGCLSSCGSVDIANLDAQFEKDLCAPRLGVEREKHHYRPKVTWAAIVGKHSALSTDRQR